MQEKKHSMTDLDLVPNSFEQHVLAQWLAHKAQKDEVPGSSHDRWILFLMFAVQQTSNSYDSHVVKISRKTVSHVGSVDF